MSMFRLDYLSCLLTVVATILVGKKMWTGFLFSGVNSVIVCIIGLHTSQYGFIPANLFCIGLYAFNIRSWRKEKRDFARIRLWLKVKKDFVRARSAGIHCAAAAVLKSLRVRAVNATPLAIPVLFRMTLLS